MPTYEYQCTSCGKSFERFHSMSAEPVKDCPFCGSTVKRLVGGGSGVIFKGTGFYKNDSRPSCEGCGAKESACPKKETA